jgi:hypothetical protein
MYHCDGKCIRIIDDGINCNIDYHSNSTGILEICKPKSNGTCITDLGNCLPQAKSGILLIGTCTYKVSSSLRQLPHIQCDSEGKNIWLNGCTTLEILRLQSFVYNTTTHPSEYVYIYYSIVCIGMCVSLRNQPSNYLH